MVIPILLVETEYSQLASVQYGVKVTVGNKVEMVDDPDYNCMSLKVILEAATEV